MTTKEIAEAVGKAEKTVRSWASVCAAKSAESSAKLAEAQRSGGKPADWTFEETITIIEYGMGKNAASLFRENAKNKTPEVTSISDIDAAFKLAIVALTSMTQNLDARMGKIEARIEQRQSLLPAPQIKPRDNVNKLVREYARKHGIDHPTAFGELYREFGYRTNSDPRRSAKNRSMAIIDYIETEGMIEILEAVAMEWAKK